jgi:hypothetical protein
MRRDGGVGWRVLKQEIRSGSKPFKTPYLLFKEQFFNRRFGDEEFGFQDRGCKQRS